MRITFPRPYAHKEEAWTKKTPMNLDYINYDIDPRRERPFEWVRYGNASAPMEMTPKSGRWYSQIPKIERFVSKFNRIHQARKKS
jgi:hypothetical protein